MRDDTDWTRAHLLAQRLAERVTAFWTGGTQEDVLDPAAAAEADELRAFFLRAPDPSTPTAANTSDRPLYVLDRSVLSKIAALHYARCSLLGPDTPEGRPEARLTLMLYGVIGRFAPDQVPEELRESVAAADLPPVEDLEVAAVRALELFGRWQAAGDETALETATALWRDMENLLPAPWPGRPMVLSNLCSGLRFRYLVRGSEADLEESVALGREAVRLAPADDPNRAMYLANLSGSLSVRYGLHKDPADLDLAVDTGQDSVRAAAEPQSLFHSNAGFALLLRYDRHAEEAETAETEGAAEGGTADDDLDAAVEAFRQAVRHAPAGDPQRPMYLANLGHALHRRFRRQGREADLDTGLDAARRAVADCPPGHPARPGYLLRLSDILRSRAELSGTSGDLDAAVDAAREALTAVPATSPDRPTATRTLGLALRLRHERLRQEADREESAALLPQPPVSDGPPSPVTSLTAPAPLTLQASHASPGSPASPGPSDFATMEVRLGNPTELDPKEWALPSPPPAGPPARPNLADPPAPLDLGNPPARPDLASPSAPPAPADSPSPPDPTEHLHHQAAALLERFRDTGDPADLDEAIDTARRGRSSSLLGEALYARAVRTDSGADLDEAIEALREANRSRADDPDDPDDPERIVDAAQLGRALLRRFGRTGEPDDLSEALTWNRRAAERITDDRDPYAHQVLFTLARTLQTVYEQSADLDALDEAVRRLEEALRAARASGPDDPTTLSRLGALLRERAGWLGGRADLDRSVELSGQAVTALPDGHPRRAAYLSALGAVLLQRHVSYGAQRDLADAVQAYRESLDATADDDTSARAARLAALGTALRRRYEYAGALADLDAAIEAYRSALSALPDGGPGSAVHRTDLAVALLARHRHGGTAADLDDAIDAARAAADALSDEHPQRATCLANLALALRHRHDSEGRRSDADEAVTRLRTAVRLSPEGHPQRPIHLTNLSSALMARCTGGDPTTHPATAADTGGAPSATDTEDATEAAHAARAALRALPEDHPQRAACLTNVGAALLIRSRANGDEDDLGTACDAFRRATKTSAAPASVRFRAARAWARAAVALQDWPQALDAYRAALTELPLPPWHGLDHGDRLPTLDGTADLAGDAAAVALNAGRPEEALSLLEHGRAGHLARALDAPDDFTGLREREPHLADRIHETRCLLQTPGPESDPATAADPARLRRAQRVAAEQRHELAQELDELLTRARELPGLEDLLRPPSPERLRAAAAHGPVVVVNTSPLRCDAIIVTTTGLRTVPLPDLHLHGDDGLTERATALLDALSPTAGSPPSAWRTQRLLTRTLAWLWDTVAAPVLTALDPTPAPRRLWWCPTGPLARLPLHAAGHYDASNTDDGRALPDHCVSSYTTTLRALALHPAPPADADVTFLPTPDSTAAPDEDIPLAAALQLTGTTHVVTAQWTVDETSAQHLANDFHTTLAHTADAPHALYEAVQRLRGKNSSPTAWAAYAHTGP